MKRVFTPKKKEWQAILDAGFREKEIAPLFAGAIGLENVCLPEGFVKVLK